MVKRLSTLSGLAVFTEDGSHVGTLEDILVNPENGKVEGILVPKPKENFLKRLNLESRTKLLIPYQAIRSIGDIVLIRSVAYEVKE